jgi:O-antigen ligase
MEQIGNTQSFEVTQRRATGGVKSDVTGAPAFAFWLLIIFLVLEYVRPAGIAQLQLQLLILLVFPFLWLFSPNRSWSPILSAQVAFLAWCAKSIPLAHNNYSAYLTTRTMYGNVAIALVLPWICSNMKDLRRVIWTWVAIMGYQAIWSITHGGRGTGGFLGDENDLALACVTAFPFAFARFDRTRGDVQWLYGAVMVLLVMGIVTSLSRGGFVGLVVVSGYCLFSSRHKLRNLVLLIVSVLALLSFAPDKYIDEIRSIRNTSEGTAQSRRFLWATAYNMWKAHPFLGVGAGNSLFHMGEFQSTNFEGAQYQDRDWSGTAVHSLYFTLLPEQGIPGMLIFGFILWSHFRILRRLRHDVRRADRASDSIRQDTEIYALGLNGAIFGYLSSGTFLSVAYYPSLWYFTALSVALDIAVRREMNRTTTDLPSASALAH